MYALLRFRLDAAFASLSAYRSRSFVRARSSRHASEQVARGLPCRVGVHVYALPQWMHVYDGFAVVRLAGTMKRSRTRGYTFAMARRFDRDRVLAARVAAAVERGAPPAELVKTAGGRIDVLSAVLATAERGSEMRRPVLEHVERLRAAVELAGGA